MEFKSKHPFTMQIMIESYVYVGFFMNIACEFVRESLPRTSKKMTLWDPMGKPWDVSYVYVFELFEEDNMRVHIYRVVPEITPLLRASNKD
ncbi:B3 domain-containing protein REM16 [Zea mays]|uniref:B3 domain-containing protein REM16 n=1 Tax=Zea mays TaxID=4577 RepID=A0A1D6PS98_MAIZE|nr:B3 domain-containing protein REM16 [Zea mays]